jgi:hypothetical protein
LSAISTVWPADRARPDHRGRWPRRAGCGGVRRVNARKSRAQASRESDGELLPELGHPVGDRGADRTGGSAKPVVSRDVIRLVIAFAAATGTDDAAGRDREFGPDFARELPGRLAIAARRGVGRSDDAGRLWNASVDRDRSSSRNAREAVLTIALRQRLRT